MIVWSGAAGVLKTGVHNLQLSLPCSPYRNVISGTYTEYYFSVDVFSAFMREKTSHLSRVSSYGINQYESSRVQCSNCSINESHMPSRLPQHI